MEEKSCLNVQIAALTESSERNGKWLVDQTNRARECNLKSAYTTVQNAIKHFVLF